MKLPLTGKVPVHSASEHQNQFRVAAAGQTQLTGDVARVPTPLAPGIEQDHLTRLDRPVVLDVVDGERL